MNLQRGSFKPSKTELEVEKREGPKSDLGEPKDKNPIKKEKVEENRIKENEEKRESRLKKESELSVFEDPEIQNNGNPQKKNDNQRIEELNEIEVFYFIIP